jgi:hypothetical protein
MPARAHNVAVPDEIDARHDLAAPDFAYACQLDVDTPTSQSAEHWARSVFENTPRPLRWFIVSGWIVGLGLRLGPRRSKGYVLGWSIVSNTPEVIVLGVGSFMLTARLVVGVTESKVIHATFVRYEHAPARIIWPVAAVVHRRVVPFLLRNAAARAV